MPARLLCAIAVVVLCLDPRAAVAQPLPAAAPANAVRVDLFALRDGEPVQDLRQEEITVLEDGVPQTIESFEHVDVASGGSRARVFVVFVDTYHTRIEDSPASRLPLVRYLDRALERDDLVAVMTPEMVASDLEFGRKAEILSNLMQAEWTWARRGRPREPGSKEDLYDRCFGRAADPGAARGRGAEMKARWREEMTLDALDALVARLATLRDERKAVLAVSEGWQLFTESKSLAEPDGDDAASDRFARLRGRRREGSATTPVMRVECEADRRRLASLDHSQRLKELSESANRANVSFYPLYAPELAADSEAAARAANAEVERAGARQDSLRYLAENTDGVAVLRRTAAEPALARIVGDATSYYLLTYHSDNTKLDGRFRSLSARVSRPDVRVRVRRGYRGQTADELLSRDRPARAGRAVAAAAPASPTRTDARLPFRIRTSSWRTPAGGTFWVVGELDYRTRRELAWTAGAKADVVVLAADGREMLSRTVDVAPENGGFSLRVPEQGAVAPGEYAVRVQLRPDANDSLVLSDTARVVLEEGGSGLGAAVVWRRGLSTGPRYLRTADTHFQRNERIRLELPTTAAGEATARLVDRAGHALQVPVQVSSRLDAAGDFRWIVAEAVLAPLAPGEYAIEVSMGAAAQSLTFSLVP